MNTTLKAKSPVLPISERYSLDQLEKLVEKEIRRLEKQLSFVEKDFESVTREKTTSTYRAMIENRRRLLDQIREQSNQFIRGVV